MDSSVNYSSAATAAHIVKHYAYGPDLLHSDLQYIIRTVISQLLLCSGTFISFLAGLGQKSSVMCNLFCLDGLYLNQFKPVLLSRQQALRSFCPNIMYCNSDPELSFTEVTLTKKHKSLTLRLMRVIACFSPYIRVTSVVNFS